MVTLKDILNLSYLKETYQMTSFGPADTIPIRHISVIEMPVDNFIRENELVLSTALGCQDDPQKLLSFITEIQASKAAALMIATKDNRYCLPEKVVEFGNLHRFPIIMIPWECRFGEIIELVLEAIKNKDLVKIKYYEALQKELLFKYLNSEDLNVAARLMSRFLACSVVITNEKGQVKGSNEDLNLDGDEDLFLPTSEMYTITIHANNRIFGHLHLWHFEDNHQNELHVNVHYIEKYTLLPLTLWFNKEDIINLTTMNLKNDFVWNLASNGFSSKEDQNLMGKKLGFNLRRPYTCIVCKVLSSSKVALMPYFEQEISLHAVTIENLILQESKKLNKNIMSTLFQGTLVIYLENTDHEAESMVHRYIDHLEDRLRQSFPNYFYYWGVSEIKTTESDFHQYYLNATLALNTCINTPQGRNRGTYEDTTIFKILSVLTENHEIQTQAKSSLKGLLDYDAQHGMELMNTLSVYIKNNYNLSQTARDLHLHRQSLLYRMKKIEELSGWSLADHNSIFLLEVYSRMHLKY